MCTRVLPFLMHLPEQKEYVTCYRHAVVSLDSWVLLVRTPCIMEPTPWISLWGVALPFVLCLLSLRLGWFVLFWVFQFLLVVACTHSINSIIQKRLSSDRERNLGLHFACNSAFLGKAIELIIRRILRQQIDGRGRGILKFLYEIERAGNFGEALQHFSLEYRQYF